MPETQDAPRRKGRQSRTLGSGREYRRFAAQGLEVRSAADGSDGIVVTGMPIRYDAPYTVWDMFGEFEETMHAGVATNVLAAGADVRFLFNHDGLPLGRTTSGTLTLTDGAEGLSMRVTLDPRQQLANDLAVAIERGDVSQMSCGFIVAMDTWNDDFTQRDVWRFQDLSDVSAVTYPASPTTSIELSLRAMMAAPVESRARLRNVWIAAREAREGKMLSAENAGLLQQALEALHEADDVDIPSIVSSLQTIDSALDAGQAGLSSVLGKANPDDDDNDDDAEDRNEEDGTAGNTDAGDGSTSTDATGSRSGAPASQSERRAAVATFNDIQRAVMDAVQAKYGDDADGWFDVWLEDCTDSWAVFHSYEDNPGVGLWQVNYTRDDTGAVTLVGDPVQVTEQTSYVPVETQRARNTALELEREQLQMRARRHVA